LLTKWDVGLSNSMIWAIATMKCEKTIKTSPIDGHACDHGLRTGFGKYDRLQIWDNLPQAYREMENGHCANHTSEEANDDSIERFYCGITQRQV